MITKGIITAIDLVGNTCTVRMPLFETSGNDPIIGTATVSNTPGSYNGYKVGDVVWVGFEDGFMDKPVIIGKLYLGVEVEQADPRGVINVENSTASKSAIMPADTKLAADTAKDVPNTMAPYTSLSGIANDLNSLNTDVGQLSRFSNNQFKSIINEVWPNGDVTQESRITQNAEHIEAKVSKTYNNTGDAQGRQYGFGWDLNEENWQINAYDTVQGHEGTKTLNIVTIDRGGMTLNGDLKINGYPHETVIKYARNTDKDNPPALYVNIGPQATTAAYIGKYIETNTNFVLVTQDNYEKLGIEEEVTNAYSINEAIWKPNEPEWQDGSYIWQWARTFKYEWIKKPEENPDLEHSYWNTSFSDTIANITGAKGSTGEPAVSYWIDVSTPIHIGKDQIDDITITPMIKIGTSGSEECDITAYIRYKFGEDTPWEGINWIKISEEPDNKVVILALDCEDKNIIIQAAHDTSSSTKFIYRTETITYSDPNTPVIDLNPDTSALNYSTNGITRIPNTDNAVTTATVYLGGKDISDGAVFSWTAPTGHVSPNDYELSNNNRTITVKNIKISPAAFTCRAVCKGKANTGEWKELQKYIIKPVFKKKKTTTAPVLPTDQEEFDPTDSSQFFDVSKAFTVTKQLQGYQGLPANHLTITNPLDMVPCTSEGVIAQNYDYAHQALHTIRAMEGTSPISFKVLGTRPTSNNEDYVVVYSTDGNVTFRGADRTEASTDPYSAYVDTLIANTGSVTYTLYKGIDDTPITTTTFTIAKNYAGANSLKITIENDFDAIPCDSNGNPPTNYDWLINTTHEIQAYDGTERVAFTITDGTPASTGFVIKRTLTGINSSDINVHATNASYKPSEKDANNKYLKYCANITALAPDTGTITYDLYKNGTFVYSTSFDVAKMKQGVSIDNVTEYYYAGASSSTHPGTTAADIDTTCTNPNKWWPNTIPAINADRPYLWNFEITNYSDGSSTPTTPTVIAIWTKDGRGIASITNYYYVWEYSEEGSGHTLPSHTIGNISSDWKTTPPNVTAAKKYLWNFEVVAYTDSSNPDISSPSVIGAYGDDAIDYDVLVESGNIKIAKNNGGRTPTRQTGISVEFYKTVGQNSATALNGAYYKVYADGTLITYSVGTGGLRHLDSNTNSFNLNTIQSASGIYIMDTATSSIKIDLCDSSGNVLEGETIDVVADGDDLTDYYIESDVDSVVINPNNSSKTPSSINFTFYKQVGNETPEKITSGGFKYTTTLNNGSESTKQDVPVSGELPYSTSSITTGLIVKLYNSSNIFWSSKAISVLTDGADGAPGSSPFSVSIANDFDSIPCDADGNPRYTTAQWQSETTHEIRVYCGIELQDFVIRRANQSTPSTGLCIKYTLSNVTLGNTPSVSSKVATAWINSLSADAGEILYTLYYNGVDTGITGKFSAVKIKSPANVYTISIDNDFATIPTTTTNAKIYRPIAESFIPSAKTYEREIVSVSGETKVLPGMKLSSVKAVAHSALNTALLWKPVEKIPITNESYVKDLTTHNVTVYCNDTVEPITADNFIVKLDADGLDPDMDAENNYLVCELGGFNSSGVRSTDFPGMDPTISTNIVTNYITALSNLTSLSQNIYIQYTYYVKGELVASTKFELVRHNGPETYYLTCSDSSVLVNVNATSNRLSTTTLTFTAHKLTTSSNTTSDFSGYWKYGWDNATPAAYANNPSTTLTITNNNSESSVDHFENHNSLTVELYTDSSYSQLWDRETIDIIRSGENAIDYYILADNNQVVLNPNVTPATKTPTKIKFTFYKRSGEGNPMLLSGTPFYYKVTKDTTAETEAAIPNVGYIEVNSSEFNSNLKIELFKKDDNNNYKLLDSETVPVISVGADGTAAGVTGIVTEYKLADNTITQASQIIEGSNSHQTAWNTDPSQLAPLSSWTAGYYCWTRTTYSYSVGPDVVVGPIRDATYALAQGKSTNYYSTTAPLNPKDGDGWFDIGYSKISPSSNKEYINNYYKTTTSQIGAIKCMVDPNDSNRLIPYNAGVTPLPTPYYLIKINKEEEIADIPSGADIYTTNVLRQYNGSAWVDISSETITNKITANYINALDITAKNITVLTDPGQDILFKAEGTNPDLSDTSWVPNVQIAGWDVTENDLINDHIQVEVDTSDLIENNNNNTQTTTTFAKFGTKDTYTFRDWSPDENNNDEDLPEEADTYSEIYDVFVLNELPYIAQNKGFGSGAKFLLPKDAYYHDASGTSVTAAGGKSIDNLYWISAFNSSATPATQAISLEYSEYKPTVVTHPATVMYEAYERLVGTDYYNPKNITFECDERMLDIAMDFNGWSYVSGGNWNRTVTYIVNGTNTLDNSNSNSGSGTRVHQIEILAPYDPVGPIYVRRTAHVVFEWAGLGQGSYEPNITNDNYFEQTGIVKHYKRIASGGGVTINPTEYQLAYGLRNFTQTSFGQDTLGQNIPYYTEPDTPSNTYWGFNSYGFVECQNDYQTLVSIGNYSFYTNYYDSQGFPAQLRIDRAQLSSEYTDNSMPTKGDTVFVIGRLQKYASGTVVYPQVVGGAVYQNVPNGYDGRTATVAEAAAIANELAVGSMTDDTYLIYGSVDTNNNNALIGFEISTNVYTTSSAVNNYDGSTNIVDENTGMAYTKADPYNGTLAVLKLQFKKAINHFDFYIRADSQADQDYLIVSDVFNLPDNQDPTYDDYVKNCVHKLFRGQVCYNDLLGSTQGISSPDNTYLANYKKITLWNLKEDDFVYIIYKKNFDGLWEGTDTGYILFPRTSKNIRPAVALGPTKEEFTVTTMGELSANQLNINGGLYSEKGEIGGWKLGYAGLTSYNSSISIQSDGNIILKDKTARLSIGGSQNETSFALGRDNYGWIRSKANFAISDTPKIQSFRQKACTVATTDPGYYEPNSAQYETFTSGFYFDFEPTNRTTVIPVTVRLDYNPTATAGTRLKFKITSSQVVPEGQELSLDLCLVYEYIDNIFLFWKWKEARTKFYVKIPGGWRSSTDGPVGAGTRYLDEYLPVLTHGIPGLRRIVGLSKVDDTNAPGFNLTFTTFIHSAELTPSIFSTNDLLPLTDDTGQKLLSTKELSKTNVYDQDTKSRVNLRYYAVDNTAGGKISTISLGSDTSRWHDIWGVNLHSDNLYSDNLYSDNIYGHICRVYTYLPSSYNLNHAHDYRLTEKADLFGLKIGYRTVKWASADAKTVTHEVPGEVVGAVISLVEGSPRDACPSVEWEYNASTNKTTLTARKGTTDDANVAAGIMYIVRGV